MWNDTINLASAGARERFAQQVTARAEVSLPEIERALLDMADRQTQQTCVTTVQEAPDDPHRLAEACLNRRWRTDDGGLCLAHYRDQFHEWNDVRYVPLGDKELRSAVTEAIKLEIDRLADGGVTDKSGFKFKVTRQLVSDVVQAIAGIVQVCDALEQPAWLDGEEAVAPRDLLAMPAGLADIIAYSEGRSYSHPPTPRFFTAHGLDYDLDPNAECAAWHHFLNQLWPDEQQSIELLQEFFGYLLLPGYLPAEDPAPARAEAEWTRHDDARAAGTRG